MSLRNHWTISYPVGSIFSRVFAPPLAANPKELERIGRPEVNGNGTASGTHTRGRSWLDSDVVKQRQQKLRKQMLKLQPHEPEIDGLQVRTHRSNARSEPFDLPGCDDVGRVWGIPSRLLGLSQRVGGLITWSRSN
jgi:hypothetical protein